MIVSETIVNQRNALQHLTRNSIDIQSVSFWQFFTFVSAFTVCIEVIGKTVAFFNMVAIHAGEYQFTFG